LFVAQFPRRVIDKKDSQVESVYLYCNPDLNENNMTILQVDNTYKEATFVDSIKIQEWTLEKASLRGKSVLVQIAV